MGYRPHTTQAMTTESIKRIEKAKHFQDVTRTAVPVAYEYTLVNADGAAFILLREPHHTDANIRRAKSYLYNTNDVVSIRTETLD